MQCYTDIIPPTAVTASIALPLLSATANNLVVARTSSIEVFTLKSVLATSTEATSKHQTNGVAKGERKERQFLSKLILVGRYNLSGIVTGLARVKAIRSKSGGELLLVALKDAKLSLLQWDPEKHSISTISIHYYERDDLQGSPFDPLNSQCQTYLTVDPGNRCAALQFGARKLAILPFHQVGDDLAMDDIDEGEPKVLKGQSSMKDEPDADATAPYSASFVLSLLALDRTFVHPLHIAFLHGYREPTLGILSAQTAPSAGLLAERRDAVNYTVYTLDLEQRASTSLLSITGLPYDISRIIPLPSPIGGALLLGANEVIHIDQSGKVNGVAVNELAQESTNFPLILQNDLDLKLEGCAVEQMGGSAGQLLIILSNGRMAVLTFKVDGRTVAGITIELVLPQNGGECLEARPSCTAAVGRNRIFVGSEDSDSTLIGWSSTITAAKRQAGEPNGDEDSEDAAATDESEDENDLYSETPTNESKKKGRGTAASISATETVFRAHDKLLNLAPLKDLRIIKPARSDPNGASNQPEALDMVCSTGKGKQGRLTRLRPKVLLEERQRFEVTAERVWSLHAAHSDMKNSTVDNETTAIVISNSDNDGSASSHVYQVRDGSLIELNGSDFDPDAGATIEMANTVDGTKLVQILSTEVRIYDGDFSLLQIFPLYEEQSDSDPKVVSASVQEPFILLNREDNSVVLLKENEAGDLERLENDEALTKTPWQSGTLFDDVDDAFHLASETADEDEAGSVLMFLLGCDGSLQIFRPPSLTAPIYVAGGLGFLPPYLTPSFGVRRSSARGALKEILVTHLGDATQQVPYLVLRSVHDDVVLYQPFQDAAHRSSEATLQFLKINDHFISMPSQESTTEPAVIADNVPVRPIQLQSGLIALLIPGNPPRLVVKTAKTNPSVFGIKSERLLQLAPFCSDAVGDCMLALTDDGKLSTVNLPTDPDFSTGWVAQHLHTDDRIIAYDYHQTTGRFVLATSSTTDFQLPQDDELHPEWREETTDFLPTVEQDTIKLLDSETGSITDVVDLDRYEVVTCVKSMSLAVSELTHERRELIGVGTAIVRGEDLQEQGCIYIYDIIPVVPEPGRPETGRKLKLLAKIKDKGAVTAITQLGNEGFLLIAHGQKCFVRGLKEDGTLLPVAFMDTQCYVSVAKELRGTNLLMLGDAFKGMWFVGYTEEPYGMKLFGKAANQLEVVAAEYLPIDNELFILIVDAEGDLYTYRYDPDNPKSLEGHRLLQAATFHTGIYPTSMTLLPRSQTAWDRLKAESADPDEMAIDTGHSHGQQVLIAADDGRLALLTPLEAQAYRTLTALQSYLTNTLPHPLGLNPKAWRNVDVDLTVGGRGVLDGNILRRWTELGTWKRSESIGRMDVEGEWEVRALLEDIGGGGLGYL